MDKYFIVGCPRSGTTALLNLLRYHDDAIWFTPEMKEKYGFKVKEKIKSGYPKFKNDVTPKAVECPLRVPSTNITNMYKVTVDKRIGRYFKDEFDKLEGLWGYEDGFMIVKFPRFGLQMKALKKIFPEAKFIHIVRDGRAVVNSLMQRCIKTGQRQSGMWGCTPPESEKYWSEPLVKRCAYQWREIVKIINRDGMKMGDDYYEIRYEDLCNITESAVDVLLEWIGRNDKDKKRLMKCFYNDMKEALQWKKNMSKMDVGTVNTMCKEELEKWGYK